MRHVSYTEGPQPRDELGVGRGPLSERLSWRPSGFFVPAWWRGSGQAVASRKMERASGGQVSNIDKHAVQAVADLKAGYTLGHADVAILNELARISLASLEATHAGGLHRL